ncbi:MAG: N-acetylglucosamine-6-phosphate deacetylase [Ignavibacteriaceae bacterium]
MKKALIGGKIVTPFRTLENSVILIEDEIISQLGKIADVAVPDGTELIDCSNCMITPGFVDLLCHGGAGASFADNSIESIKTASEYFLKHGSTTLLASLHAKPYELLLNDLKRVSDYLLEHPESNIYGIHMEGPFLNKVFKGAMNEEYLWTPSKELWDALWEASQGTIKLMTIAPELPGALDVIREAAKKGVVVSIGHSMATYAEIEAAIDNGAAHVTHIFNAMKPLHHRNPGVLLSSLLRNELKIELIADTFHVHNAVMELLLKLKGSDGIILITDSIKAGGMHEGEYDFADQKVIMKDKKAFLHDGTLAGSTLTLNTAIKNINQLGNAKINDAVRMASLNGAKVLGISRQKGIIAVGKDADIVIMDPDFNVVMTLLKGKKVI